MIHLVRSPRTTVTLRSAPTDAVPAPWHLFAQDLIASYPAQPRSLRFHLPQREPRRFADFVHSGVSPLRDGLYTVDGVWSGTGRWDGLHAVDRVGDHPRLRNRLYTINGFLLWAAAGRRPSRWHWCSLLSRAVELHGNGVQPERVHIMVVVVSVTVMVTGSQCYDANSLLTTTLTLTGRHGCLVGQAVSPDEMLDGRAKAGVFIVMVVELAVVLVSMNLGVFRTERDPTHFGLLHGATVLARCWDMVPFGRLHAILQGRATSSI